LPVEEDENDHKKKECLKECMTIGFKQD